VTAIAPLPAVFDRWAEVYDAQSNPLLLLEERTIAPLFPPLDGARILDVGCGTGRWLQRLEPLHAASLHGTDSSPAMLERARGKLAPTTQLTLTTCSLPSPDVSQDLILLSFVLSYIEDLPALAHECARTLKPGGHLILSDMHPDTERQRGWTRSFSFQSETIRLATYHRTLSEIVAAFTQSGLSVCAVLEPSFDENERFAFAEAGHLDDFEALVSFPAIYLLKLQKPRAPDPRARPLEPK